MSYNISKMSETEQVKLAMEKFGALAVCDNCSKEVSNFDGMVKLGYQLPIRDEGKFQSYDRNWVCLECKEKLNGVR